MYSKKDDPKEVQDFMKNLGFPSNEDSNIFENVIKCFKEKEITLINGELKIVGTLHSATLIWGNYLNLTKVKEDECSPDVLEQLHYYHPRNFNPELNPKYRNYGFVNASFVKENDPEKDDLLVVPVDGCTLICEGFNTTFPVPEEEENDED